MKAKETFSFILSDGDLETYMKSSFPRVLHKVPKSGFFEFVNAQLLMSRCDPDITNNMGAMNVRITLKPFLRVNFNRKPVSWHREKTTRISF